MSAWKTDFFKILETKNWTVINADFCLNPTTDEFIDISSNKLSYGKSGVPVDEIPLLIWFLFYGNYDDDSIKESLPRLMLFIDMLEKRNLIPIYLRDTFQFSEEYWGFETFTGFQVFDNKEDCVYISSAKGVFTQYYNMEGSLDNEILKNIFLEISKIVNPNFLFDKNTNSFYIDPDAYNRIIEYNKSM